MLYIMHSTPGLQPGTWKIELISAARAGVAIEEAVRSNRYISLVRFPDTRDLLATLAGVSIRLHRKDDRPAPLPREGEQILCVLLNREGKARPPGSTLEVGDVDFYLITIEK